MNWEQLSCAFFPGTQRYILGGTVVMAAKAFAHVFHHARRLAQPFRVESTVFCYLLRRYFANAVFFMTVLCRM